MIHLLGIIIFKETEPNILHSPLKIKIKLNPDLTLNEKQNRRKGKRRKRKKETRECKDVECKTTLGGLTDPTTVNHQIESCQPGQLKLRIPISKLISNLTDISKNVQNLQIPKSNETDDVRERSNPVVPRLKIRLRTPKENEDHLRNLTPVSFPSPHEFRQNGSSQFVLDPGNIKPAQFSSCSG